LQSDELILLIFIKIIFSLKEKYWRREKEWMKYLQSWVTEMINKIKKTYPSIFGCDNLLRSWTSRSMLGRFDRRRFIFRTITSPVTRCVTWWRNEERRKWIKSANLTLIFINIRR
jgi:hypothetical protein